MVHDHRELLGRRQFMRIGVDTGGTFTDCVVLDGGQVKILKVFSTPADASRAIVEGVLQLAELKDPSRRPPRERSATTSEEPSAVIARSHSRDHGWHQ